MVADVNGNIAMAKPPYALAQDAASAIKLFKGDYYYNTTLGIPYFEQILGKNPPVQLMKTQFQNAALTVPEVVKAVCYLSAIDHGKVSGQVQIKDSNGKTSIAGF